MTLADLLRRKQDLLDNSPDAQLAAIERDIETTRLAEEAITKSRHEAQVQNARRECGKADATALKALKALEATFAAMETAEQKLRDLGEVNAAGQSAVDPKVRGVIRAALVRVARIRAWEERFNPDKYRQTEITSAQNDVIEARQKVSEYRSVADGHFAEAWRAQLKQAEARLATLEGRDVALEPVQGGLVPPVDEATAFYFSHVAQA